MTTTTTDTPYLVAGAGILAVALVLEDLIAQTHGVSPLQIHEHTVVPYATHGLAIVSMAIVLWPRWQEIRRSDRGSPVRWQSIGIAVIAIVMLLGQVMIAAVTAFASSGAVSVVSRTQRRKSSSGRQR